MPWYVSDTELSYMYTPCWMTKTFCIKMLTLDRYVLRETDRQTVRKQGWLTRHRQHLQTIVSDINSAIARCNLLMIRYMEWTKLN